MEKGGGDEDAKGKGKKIGKPFKWVASYNRPQLKAACILTAAATAGFATRTNASCSIWVGIFTPMKGLTSAPGGGGGGSILRIDRGAN